MKSLKSDFHSKRLTRFYAILDLSSPYPRQDACKIFLSKLQVCTLIDVGSFFLENVYYLFCVFGNLQMDMLLTST